MKTSIISKKQNIFFGLGIICILLVWFILTLFDDDIFFPKINEVVIDLGKLLSEGNNWLIILYTFLKVIGLIVASFVISFIFAIVSYKLSSFRSFISPMIVIMRSTPVASVILILILLVGSKIAPFIISLLVIVPIAYENIYSAFSSIDNDVIDETKLISNINLKIIITVFIPITVTYLVSTLLSCFGLCLKVLVMSEVLTQGNMTIGGNIQLAKATIDITRVFSWSIVLVVIVLIVELLIKIVERKVSNYKGGE